MSPSELQDGWNAGLLRCLKGTEYSGLHQSNVALEKPSKKEVQFNLTMTLEEAVE